MATYKNTDGYCLSDTSSFPLHTLNWRESSLNDPICRIKIDERWAQIRRGFLSNDSVMFVIDSYIQQLANSTEFHYKLIPSIDQWVWPSQYVGSTYEIEIVYLKSWLLKRLYWLDNKLLLGNE